MQTKGTWRPTRCSLREMAVVCLVVFVSASLYLAIYSEKSSPFKVHVVPLIKQPGDVVKWSNNSFKELPKVFTCETWIVADTGKYPSAQRIKNVLDKLQVQWCAIFVSETFTRSYTLKFPQGNQYRLHIFVPSKQNGTIYETDASKYATILKYHVSRKTIGYLVAIAKGARMIYDDDEEIGHEWLASSPPLDNKGADIPFVIPAGKVNFWNPFSYFYFKKDVWPRGFPEEVSRRPACNAPPVPYALRNSSVLLVHYLIDGYADVPEGILKSPLKFNKSGGGPVEIQEGTFVPYSQHSTLHMYDVFWGLLIPTTCEESICDIIRGYITQRLLWDINGSMSVSPPWTKRTTPSRRTSGQNSQSKDTTLIKLTNLLLAWSSNSTSIDKRLKELYLYLFDKGIILKEDLAILDTWIQLLKTAGYVFPRAHVPSWAERRAMPKPWDGVRLCVHFNHIPGEQPFTTLYQMYSRHFKEITFTGEGATQPFMDTSVPFLPCTDKEQEGGKFLHRCLLKHLTYEGFGNKNTSFLFVSDDTFFNLSSFLSYRRDAMWILGPIETYDINITWPDGWMWWPQTYGGAALRKIIDIMPGAWREGLAHVKNWTKSGKRLISKYNADTVFIPNNRYRARFIEVLKWMTGPDIPRLFAEIALPLLVDLTTEKADRSDVIPMKNSYPWSDLGAALQRRSCNLLHPLKLSKDSDRITWLSMFKSVEKLLQTP
ncbi:probable glycosyltransferase STELLO1 [Lingula anatina]|uniref:Probable glycosyltransferase STELLO1 n=1 Tax=Lingula anatina TaxID=7574 RepID=A0A1S3J1R9_LINAN|nr:probable glycosyltransferase STELLO1 [Lingula anatina]XP_013404382.1 probable glycosyltransferase STELLO1 [Lingula anatina]XP_023931085.1 probable glycosyltransferase STELLO1 [Lingula anatina]|eukprot:XP_013404381.1 probable glycosyltransferase STELLO1 [Lingula anatina]